MPEMIVNPMWHEESGQAVVYLGVANPSNEDLVIRRGQVYATLTELRGAEWQHAAEKRQFENEARVAAVVGGVDGALDDIDGLDDRDWRHNKTAAQVIDEVLGGRQCGRQTLAEWAKDNTEDLHFGPRCTDKKKELCTALLYAMQDVLSKGQGAPPVLNGYEHKIELIDPDAAPRKCKTRRYSPAELRAIREECDKMIENDVVEVSDSPWAAPVVMVKKKDNSWRFCVDYRMTINPLCRADSMPLPKIADLLDTLAEAEEMSCWDLFAGYWQCLVRQQDRKYLAFTTDTHGLLQFKRLPFGMATSGAHFQRSMQKILEKDPLGPVLNSGGVAEPDANSKEESSGGTSRPSKVGFTKIYIDDGCTWTRKGGDHLEDLLRVLKLLKIANAALKLKKCTWCTDEATLCGFEVRCGQGVKADLRKVCDLAAISKLGQVKVLKSFLGSCVYLAKFVKDYAEISAPLYALEKKLRSPETALHSKHCTGKCRHEQRSSEGCHWHRECERSMEAIKAALISAPVLAFPDWSRPFIVLSDCSELSMAGVLLQIDEDGVERPIAYASRRLNKAEQNYHISDKECAAGLFCIRKWRM